jgi:hypothetical protein
VPAVVTRAPSAPNTPATASVQSAVVASEDVQPRGDSVAAL